MKYKISDKVKVKVTIKEPTQEIAKGDICTVIDIFPNDIYQVSDEAGHHWLFVEKMLESAVPTLAGIKEKKLTYVVHTPTRDSAEIIANTIPVDDEGTIDCDWSSFWDTYKDDTCYKIVDGELYSYQSKEFFENNSYTIYEFSDLFPVGSAMVCGDCVYKRTESGIKNYKLVEECAVGGIVTLKPRDESLSFASASFIATAESISHITGIPYENSINKLKTCLSAFPNDGISAKNGGKNSMKFTFYVTEGTRVDKSCNGTIPTMTTMVSYIDKYGCIMKGTATCDKADYDERQGVLEALANATCGDNFYKAYAEAIKFNRYEDELSRTCAYCGQLLDTREEREEHEAWHGERRKARRERYLLRKRAKEIAFEEAAQKLAKEIIAEDNKK